VAATDHIVERKAQQYPGHIVHRGPRQYVRDGIEEDREVEIPKMRYLILLL